MTFIHPKNIKTKPCTKCKKELEINRDNFYVRGYDIVMMNGSRINNFYAACKTCMKKSQMVRDKKRKSEEIEFDRMYPH